jgi:hypothetical protein
VFASQLFWAGYVTPWSKAFSQEVVYYRELRDRQLKSSPAISATAAALAKLGLKDRPAA